jgi:hypothetical protein
MKTISHFTRFALTLALAAGTFASAFAGPTRTTALARLQSEIRSIMDSPSETYRGDLEGEAEVFFTVDAHKRIQVKGVFSTSDDLATYIENKLDGATVRRADVETGSTYRMKLRLQDLR